MVRVASLCLLLCTAVVGAHAQELQVESVEELLKLERFHVFNLGSSVNSEYSEYNPV